MEDTRSAGIGYPPEVAERTWQLGDRRSHNRTVSSVEPERTMSSRGDISSDVTLSERSERHQQALLEMGAKLSAHFRLWPLKYRM